jgi:hypothetical protein
LGSYGTVGEPAGNGWLYPEVQECRRQEYRRREYRSTGRVKKTQNVRKSM